MYTNIHGLIRELLGPRPLFRVTDIVSNPHIWNCSGMTISLENQTTVQTARAGKDRGVVSMPEGLNFLFRQPALHGESQILINGFHRPFFISPATVTHLIQGF